MRTFGSLAVCLFVLVAGCGGAGPATETATTVTTTSAGGTATTATTTTTGPTTTTRRTATTTAPGGTGDLPADASQRHVDALRQAGSLTTVTEAAYANDTGTVFSFRTVSRLDVGADRGYRNGSVAFPGPPGDVVTTSYTDGDVTYERVRSASGTEYRRERAPYTGGNVTPVTFESVVGGIERDVTDAGVQFTRTGTTTVGGIEVTGYRAEDEALAGLYEESEFGNATVVGASLTVFVDDEGVFRRIELTIRYETVDGRGITFEFVQRITDVGSTTVAEPEWIDEARREVA